MSKREPKLTKREKRLVKKADENRDGRIYRHREPKDHVVTGLIKKGITNESGEQLVPSKRPAKTDSQY